MTGVIKIFVSYSISRVPPRAPSFLHPLHRHVPRTYRARCTRSAPSWHRTRRSRAPPRARSPPLVVVPSHLRPYPCRPAACWHSAALNAGGLTASRHERRTAARRAILSRRGDTTQETARTRLGGGGERRRLPLARPRQAGRARRPTDGTWRTGSGVAHWEQWPRLTDSGSQCTSSDQRVPIPSPTKRRPRMRNADLRDAL